MNAVAPGSAGMLQWQQGLSCARLPLSSQGLGEGNWHSLKFLLGHVLL